LFESSFERWDELSGINYQYEPNDDGDDQFAFRGINGQQGFRGDTRIGGHPLNSSTLGYASFPSFGDIVIATNQVGRWSDDTGNFQQFRNVLMHEIGHALGLGHVSTGAASFLLNGGPLPLTTFDGPQLDDILGLQRLYGDVNEQNGGNETSATATLLGSLAPGSPIAIGTNGDSTVVAPTDVADVDFISIDTSEVFSPGTPVESPVDIDVFSFTITSPSFVDISLTPKGLSYLVGPEDGPTAFYDSSSQVDLNLELLGTDGTTLLDSSSVNGLGKSEEILGSLLAPGEYFVRVQGEQKGTDGIQLFQLDLAATAVPEPTSFALLAVVTLWLPCRRRSRR